ncbi:MAG: hypothetical protein RL568_1027 [Actinomycetota bacterium]
MSAVTPLAPQRAARIATQLMELNKQISDEAQNLTKALKGDIIAESEPDNGTTFRFWIPFMPGMLG